MTFRIRFYHDGSVCVEDPSGLLATSAFKHFLKPPSFVGEDSTDVTRYMDSELWWKNGHLHRKNGPAAIHSTGEQFWFNNGSAIDRPANVETKYESIVINGVKYDLVPSKEA